MRIRLLPVSLLCTVLPLSACSSSAGPDPAPSAPPSTSPAASGQARAYLDGLTAIHPGLAVNDERALSRAKDTCLDIQQGEFTGPKLSARVAERLSGGDATVTPQQAGQVVELAKRTVCK